MGEVYPYVPFDERRLVPLWCDWDKRPMGFAALFVAREMIKKQQFCSDACEVMAEWHAPERR